MTLAAMKERAHQLINEADELKMEAVLATLEDEISAPYEWSEDKEFVAELDERVRRYEAGIDKGTTWEELEAKMDDRKKSRALNG